MTDLAQTIASAQASLTKLEQRIADYLLSRPEVVAIESSAEIAKKLDVSPMTVSRFFKKLGYESSLEARSKIKADLYAHGAARLDNRYGDFSLSLGGRDLNSDHQVALTAINCALEHRRTFLWREVVRLVAETEAVFLAGFQTMHYLAGGLAMRLRYIRNNVTVLDGADGVYGEFFASGAKGKVLIIIDTFRYGANGPRLARAAREEGAEVIVFCDELCDWAAELTDKTIVFPSESYYFLGLPVGINFSLNLLMQDVVLALGERGKAHVERISVSQDRFGAYSK
ncbi:hypothetical protein BJF92_18685 [Rhizobium rhizosphaerae]|uniref:HTH rpiR-type domain-containing protein n=1 Tax=Xaviernesmea rhizosphaerae TaxID=1672749 RepID=A0A1Q9ADQ8_9HYPH|nr:MurR/RpiR family transcriptional regulator [Xaviernesmea rhizosphaerae]OLP53059.1 hypothetical protein BJF92_18685 [Xaviernesmea rhizosphaerae]OQP87378.1 hypothetical protein BTR14_05420 [Xaviernesmea rhizosphaerae]